MFSLSLLFFLLLLLVALQQQRHAVEARRRHREVHEFFPGCLEEVEELYDEEEREGEEETVLSNVNVNVNGTSFAECMQERADKRCWNQQQNQQNMGQCMRENMAMNMNMNMNNGNSNNGNMMSNRNNHNNGNAGGNPHKNDGNGNGNGEGNRPNNNHNNGQNQGVGNSGGMGGNPQNNNMGNGPNQDNGNSNGNWMGNGNMGNNQGNGNRPPGLQRRQQLQSFMANCTEDFRMCARERLEEDIQQLPNCVAESLRNLTTCMRDNRDTCRASCRSGGAQQINGSTAANSNSTSNGMSMIPERINPNSLRSCNGIRNRIFRRVCHRSECCNECLEPFEQVATCFVANVMQDLTEHDDCPIDCQAILATTEQSQEEEDDNEDEEGEDNENLEEGEEDTTDGNARHRRLVDFEHWMQQQEKQNMDDESLDRAAVLLQLRRALQEQEAINDNNGDNTIFDACIEVAPGLNEASRDEQELALRADFFDCIVDEMLTIVEVNSDDVHVNPQDGEDSATGDSTSSGSASANNGKGITAMVYVSVTVSALGWLMMVVAIQ